MCGDSALWRGAPPHALGLMVPLNVLPIRVAIALSFCEHCLADRGEDALGQATVVKMREGMLPNLRLLPPMMQQAGHA